MPTSSLPESEFHIICVDDDADFIKSLSLILPDTINQMNDSGSWIRFSFFTEPLEALDFVKELHEMNEDIAMIITDQKMPVMKGTELLESIRPFAMDAVCIMLTGYAGIESAVEAINGKLLDRYLTKPIEDQNDFAVNIYQMFKSFRMGRTISNQSQTLQDLFGFSNTLNSLQNFGEALDYVIAFTASKLRCDSVSIMLLEEDGKHLEIAASKGVPDDVVKSTRLAVREGAGGESDAANAVNNREAVYAKDVTELGYVIEPGAQSDAIFVRMPILWANLKSGQKPVGVINVSNRQDGKLFHESDPELLTYIANTASIAINNHINSRKLKEAFIEMKAHSAALTRVMSYNSVTGLPNRKMFEDTLRKMIGVGSTSDKPLTIILLNLMRFREINCAIGHNNGDTLLKSLGQRLEEMVEKPSQLFHFGSDEFAVLMPGISYDDTREPIAKAQALLQKPSEIKGVQVDTDMTFGIVSYPDHATDYKVLMQKADVALSMAKQSEYNVFVYDESRDKFNTRRLSMVNELRHAIDIDELVLYYQPKIDLQSNDVVGVEALVRWIHPEHGFTPPDQFIPLAEQTGLMEALTGWVIKEAARQCREWNQKQLYKHPINIAVNLSTINLVEDSFANKVEAICQAAEVSPKQLNLEITESVIMGNIDKALETLNQLYEKEFSIHLDDFGTGYSSLAYVKRLPIDSIKIDRSFVMDITEQTQDVQIVQSIVELGHSLDLKIIAEGIENEVAGTLLKQLGCDTVQGYYYSRPLPPADFETWLAEYSA